MSDPIPEDVPLFDVDPAMVAPAPEDEGMSAGQRLTRRQATAVRAGLHPLAALDPRVRRHPDTLRWEYTADSPRGRDLTCGTCSARYGNHRGYPKCHQFPSLMNGSAASDCRAWWPACDGYLPARDGAAPWAAAGSTVGSTPMAEHGTP